MGSPLANFTDFMKDTDVSIISSPDHIINEAVLNTYSLARMLKGGGADIVLNGGDQITDMIMFDESSTAQHYDPNETFSPENPQVQNTITIDWRYTADHMTWTNQEVMLQAGSGLSRKNRFIRYKNLKRSKEQRLATSLVNFIEGSIWRDPNSATAYAKMETNTQSPGQPYSIPAMVNEETNGLANGWTLKASISPASQSKWVPQQVQYDYNDPDDSDGDRDGLIEAFDDMLERIRFLPPKYKNEHFEPKSMQLDSKKCVIMTQREGKTLYKQMLRASNDTLVRKQDAEYNNPEFAGYDVMHIAQLNAATLYAGSGSTWVAQDAATVTTKGPRYYWLNFNYLKMLFHGERYFVKEEPIRHPNQPFTRVQYVDTWHNMFPCSLQRQGIVYPGA